MLFGFLKQKRQEKADDQQHWRERWQSLVPEENRSVPVTVDGQTRIAYIQINQFVVMLQDGLLMKAHFFDVCEFFQKAGYHVVWLMRCVQDVEDGYLKLVRCRRRSPISKPAKRAFYSASLGQKATITRRWFPAGRNF